MKGTNELKDQTRIELISFDSLSHKRIMCVNIVKMAPRESKYINIYE